ncbi:MAG: hypothetical protein K2Y39_10170 [Candidatus Obscuribacterales bacterium]|nr:hypothetical protein [Candidatus Obscuribacterales bacterium]
MLYAVGSEKPKAGSTAFTKASVQVGFGNENTTIWLKSCDSPARFYLDRLEGKPLNHRVELPASKGKGKHTPSRLRKMQKPRGIRSSLTDCIRWLLSWRLFGPIFAF